MVGMSFLSLGNAVQGVSAEEYSSAMESGGSCIPVCDVNREEVGKTCFIPKQDGRGGGELYMSKMTLDRLQRMRAGASEVPPLLLPPDLEGRRPWCKVHLSQEDIEKVISAYLGRRADVAPADVQGALELPPLAGDPGWTTEKPGEK